MNFDSIQGNITVFMNKFTGYYHICANGTKEPIYEFEIGHRFYYPNPNQPNPNKPKYMIFVNNPRYDNSPYTVKAA